MKDTYRIGEIARMLDISSESIRYYEQAGLIHPGKNPENGYRIYTIENIYELMDVMFYRKMNMPIQEISTITHATRHQDIMKDFVRQKELLILETIHSQKLLLQKIEALDAAYDAVDAHLGRYSILPLPSFYIMQDMKDETFQDKGEKPFLSRNEFKLCTFGGKAVLTRGKWIEGYKHALLKRKQAATLGLEEQLSAYPVIDSRRGAYTVFLRDGNHSIDYETKRLLGWMAENGYQPAGDILFNYMLAVYAQKSFNTYVELFAPIV